MRFIHSVQLPCTIPLWRPQTGSIIAPFENLAEGVGRTGDQVTA
jgi:hypothetical protein